MSHLIRVVVQNETVYSQPDGAPRKPGAMPAGLVQVVYMWPRAAYLSGQVGTWSDDALWELADSIYQRGIPYLFGDPAYWQAIGIGVKVLDGPGQGLIRLHLDDIFMDRHRDHWK